MKGTGHLRVREIDKKLVGRFRQCIIPYLHGACTSLTV